MTGFAERSVPKTDVDDEVPASIRVVCYSDTHTSYDKGVLTEPVQADLLLHAGDATFRGEPLELAAFNAWLHKQPAQRKIFVPGNHELTFEKHWDWACKQLPEAHAILDQRAYVLEVVTEQGTKKLKIYGEPRQPWFFGWAYNVQREDMQRTCWDKVPKDTDILVTHGPPFGAGDLNTKGQRIGCVALRRWIEQNQPRLVVCGHNHGGYGIYTIGKTIVVNASNCDPNYKAVNPPIVVDLSL